jgi:hypothetical protein
MLNKQAHPSSLSLECPQHHNQPSISHHQLKALIVMHGMLENVAIILQVQISTSNNVLKYNKPLL